MNSTACDLSLTSLRNQLRVCHVFSAKNNWEHIVMSVWFTVFIKMVSKTVLSGEVKEKKNEIQ